MRKNFVSTKKKNQRMFLLLIILGVTIGFAALATTLKINGFALIGKSSWDIRWDKTSITMSEEMPADMEEEDKPQVSTSTNGTPDDTVTFTVNLDSPGDFYEFYIDAKNSGSYDGTIASVETTWKKDGEVLTEIPNFLKYTVVYADERVAPAVGDKLLKNESKKYFVRLEYNEDANVLIEDDMQISAEISINYRQGVPEDPRGPGSEVIETKSEEPPTPVPAPEPTDDDDEEEDEEDIPDPVPITNPVRIALPAVTNATSSGGTETNPASTDIVYTGPQPGNYIYFNCDSLSTQDADHCEVWRIIKTDSDAENRIKIIRNEPLEDKMAWNTAGSAKMSNDWEHSTLKQYLNGDYYNSLSEVSQKLIPEVKWYTAGGYNVTRVNSGKLLLFDSTSGMTGASAYVNERTKFITRDLQLRRNDTYAKVGLMYASDYGYASSTCYSNCTATGVHPCVYNDPCTVTPDDDGSYIDDYYDMFDGYGKAICRNSNWLYAEIDEWTMTASMYTDYDEGLSGESAYWADNFASYCQDSKRVRDFPINGYGDVPECYYGRDSECDKGYRRAIIIDHSYSDSTNKWYGGYTSISDVIDTHYVRPVVYLKNGINLEGTGTQTDPYRIIASNSVLDGDDHYVEPEKVSPTIDGEELASYESDSGSCSDRVKPTCELNYVNVLSNGFEYAYNCSDDVQIDKLTSLFDTHPASATFESQTFDAIGTNKNGVEIRDGKTRTYSGKWTTNSSTRPVSGTCYYFVYGGKDRCGNWQLYKSPECYQY